MSYCYCTDIVKVSAYIGKSLLDLRGYTIAAEYSSHMTIIMQKAISCQHVCPVFTVQHGVLPEKLLTCYIKAFCSNGTQIPISDNCYVAKSQMYCRHKKAINRCTSLH